MNSESLVKVLHERYATKKFDASRKIPDSVWSALKESLRLAPSSYGMQPWKFIDVRDPGIRSKLREASWNQTQVTDSDRYLVFAYRTEISVEDVTRFMESIVKERGVTLDSLAGYRRVIEGDLVTGGRAKEIETWSQRQVYIALGFGMLSAAVLGVDTCPMEGIDAARYDELLGLGGSGYRTVGALALGYRDPADAYSRAKKVRYPESEVFVTLE